MRREGLRLVRLAVFSQKPHLHDISEQRYISVFQDAPMKVPFRALLSDPLHFFCGVLNPLQIPFRALRGLRTVGQSLDGS